MRIVLSVLMTLIVLVGCAPKETQLPLYEPTVPILTTNGGLNETT